MQKGDSTPITTILSGMEVETDQSSTDPSLPIDSRTAERDTINDSIMAIFARNYSTVLNLISVLLCVEITFAQLNFCR